MSSTLFIDLASHESLFALVDEKKTIAVTPVNGKDESALMQIIESMLQKNGGTVDRITVIVGPGGFMSLRVGVSLANALAWARKIPIAGIHLNDLWSLRAQTSKLQPSSTRGGLRPASKAQSFLWLHSTKRDALFIRGFGSYEKEWPEPRVISVIDVKKSMERTRERVNEQPMFFVGELIPEHEKALPVQRFPSLQGVSDILPSLLQNLDFHTPPILPWYGRGA